MKQKLLDLKNKEQERVRNETMAAMEAAKEVIANTPNVGKAKAAMIVENFAEPTHADTEAPTG